MKNQLDYDNFDCVQLRGANASLLQDRGRSSTEVVI